MGEVVYIGKGEEWAQQHAAPMQAIHMSTGFRPRLVADQKPIAPLEISGVIAEGDIAEYQHMVDLVMYDTFRDERHLDTVAERELPDDGDPAKLFRELRGTLRVRPDTFYNGRLLCMKNQQALNLAEGNLDAVAAFDRRLAELELGIVLSPRVAALYDPIDDCNVSEQTDPLAIDEQLSYDKMVQACVEWGNPFNAERLHPDIEEFITIRHPSVLIKERQQLYGTNDLQMGVIQEICRTRLRAHWNDVEAASADTIE